MELHIEWLMSDLGLELRTKTYLGTICDPENLPSPGRMQIHVPNRELLIFNNLTFIQLFIRITTFASN